MNVITTLLSCVIKNPAYLAGFYDVEYYNIN